MKVLITGALGYIGNELLLRLSKRPDISVIGLDNDSDAFRNYAGHWSRFENIHLFYGDISNQHDLFAVGDVDIVIHLAAIVGYVDCGERPADAHKTNIIGSQNVASLKRPTIFLSTGSVYGQIGPACSETTVPNPTSLYATTKLQGEKFISENPCVIFRPATAYGLGFKTRHDLLLHTLVRDAIKDGIIHLYEPHSERSLYSVAKIAELLEYTLDHFDLMSFAGVMNVGDESGNVSKKGLCNLISQYVDFELQLIEGKDRDNRNYSVDYSKLRRHWLNSRDNLDQNIKKIVEYYTWVK